MQVKSLLCLSMSVAAMIGMSGSARALGAAEDSGASQSQVAYSTQEALGHAGACSELVIHAYQAQGIDLEQLVQTDKEQARGDYPDDWGFAATGVEERKVTSLATYFKRNGFELSAGNYEPGDLVTWTVSGNHTHIGIVIADTSADGTPMVVHDAENGPEVEDVLGAQAITGHYRFLP
ncbi:DUF1287 domain-containing protein [Emcibacter sp.]|uniref:DUF1287 domain-containing protein n=1 Tax=Emcibacter sp. TaxID=1979954 RepID=UPI003A92DD2D